MIHFTPDNNTFLLRRKVEMDLEGVGIEGSLDRISRLIAITQRWENIEEVLDYQEITNRLASLTTQERVEINGLVVLCTGEQDLNAVTQESNEMEPVAA